MSFVEMSSAEVQELLERNFDEVRRYLEAEAGIESSPNSVDPAIAALAFELATSQTKNQVDSASWSRCAHELSKRRTQEAQAGEYISPKRAKAENKWLASVDGELVVSDRNRDRETIDPPD